MERVISGKDLVGLRYQPLYLRIDTVAYPEAYQALAAAFVSFEDGTGIVHIAPAYGEDDFSFKRRGIPPTFSVNEKGIMSDGLPGAGKFAKEADGDIRADLRDRGLLFRDEEIRHTYPFCWRCDTPLLYFARSSWYITMSKLRSEIQERNQTIHWLPGHIKDGRFGEWLRELKDWAITRERYWGAPIPIWECDRCQQREIVGSFAELIAKAPTRNRFILMRHGEARSNVEHRINSKLETSPQYPLTARGKERVAAVVERLRSVGITRIIASPFHRMRQTAAIVSKAVGIPVTYDERLREFDIPDFDGKSETEFNGRFASAFEKFNTKIGANETWNELARRILLALKDIDARHEGETILICSHGDPLFLLRWAYSGRTKEGIKGMPYPDFDNPQEFAFTSNLVNDRGELDVHRPFIDGITWPCGKECGGTMRRFPEVVDVWLESGCMPFAQVHWPFEAASRQPQTASSHPPTPPLPAGGGETKKIFSPSHREGEREGVGSQMSDVNGQASPPALYPADYISEAIDQTRGWFYTLLAVATVLGWESPYKNVICYSHILDREGKKMSKSKGNVVNPIAMIDRYGADVVRWYMVAVNQPWDAKLFDEEDLKRMSRKPFGTLMNLLSFWQLHGGNARAEWPTPPQPPTPHKGRGETKKNFSPSHREGEREGVGNVGALLDHWLRARTRQTYDAVTQHLDAYELTDAARAINDLVDDLSTWWLRRSRERLKEGDAGARGTFTAALHSLAILLAPFAPYTAEHLWRALAIANPHPPPPPLPEGGGEIKDFFSPSSRGGARGGVASVHFAMWDTAAPPAADGDATPLQQMAEVRRLCSLGLEARAEAGIPVRQPLAVLRVPTIFSPSSRGGARGGADAVNEALLQLIADELNVKEVVIDPSLKDTVSLDTTLTPELKREGMVRELTRAVNNLRKEMGLTSTDRIRVTYHTDDAELAQAIAEQQTQLERAVVATSFSPSSRGGARGGASEPRVLTIASIQITLDITREA